MGSVWLQEKEIHIFSISRYRTKKYSYQLWVMRLATGIKTAWILLYHDDVSPINQLTKALRSSSKIPLLLISLTRWLEVLARFCKTDSRMNTQSSQSGDCPPVKMNPVELVLKLAFAFSPFGLVVAIGPATQWKHHCLKKRWLWCHWQFALQWQWTCKMQMQHLWEGIVKKIVFLYAGPSSILVNTKWSQWGGSQQIFSVQQTMFQKIWFAISAHKII